LGREYLKGSQHLTFSDLTLHNYKILNTTTTSRSAVETADLIELVIIIIIIIWHTGFCQPLLHCVIIRFKIYKIQKINLNIKI